MVSITGEKNISEDCGRMVSEMNVSFMMRFPCHVVVIKIRYLFFEHVSDYVCAWTLTPSRRHTVMSFLIYLYKII